MHFNILSFNKDTVLFCNHFIFYDISFMDEKIKLFFSELYKLLMPSLVVLLIATVVLYFLFRAFGWM